MWAFESQLYAEPNPSNWAGIDDYERIIGLYNNPRQNFLPLLQQP
jgi:hypothetical protein